MPSQDDVVGENVLVVKCVQNLGKYLHIDGMFCDDALNSFQVVELSRLRPEVSNQYDFSI